MRAGGGEHQPAGGRRTRCCRRPWSSRRLRRRWTTRASTAKASVPARWSRSPVPTTARRASDDTTAPAGKARVAAAQWHFPAPDAPTSTTRHGSGSRSTPPACPPRVVPGADGAGARLAYVGCRMPHSFRFDPPVPRPASIVRPRLLRVTLARWEHRVTVVMRRGGPGEDHAARPGARREPPGAAGPRRLARPRPGDADGENLARDLTAALLGAAPEARGPVPEARAVADLVWRRAPQHVCLVLDNVHPLPEGSPGAAWLAGLVELLPSNGHVVLGPGRGPGPARHAGGERRAGRGHRGGPALHRDELAGFAERHAVDPAVLRSTGGWPAMAELVASVEADLAGRYLWEEVLRPLGPERRRVLAALCTLGGADDALASATLGRPVDLARELAGVPLIAVGADGGCVPHALWRRAPRLDLGDERPEAVRRAGRHLVADRRYDDAVRLAAGGSPSCWPTSSGRRASRRPGRPGASWTAGRPCARPRCWPPRPGRWPSASGRRCATRRPRSARCGGPPQWPRAAGDLDAELRGDRQPRPRRLVASGRRADRRVGPPRGRAGVVGPRRLDVAGGHRRRAAGRPGRRRRRRARPARPAGARLPRRRLGRHRHVAGGRRARGPGRGRGRLRRAGRHPRAGRRQLRPLDRGHPGRRRLDRRAASTRPSPPWRPCSRRSRRPACGSTWRSCCRS